MSEINEICNDFHLNLCIKIIMILTKAAEICELYLYTDEKLIFMEKKPFINAVGTWIALMFNNESDTLVSVLLTVTQQSS